MAEMTDRPSIPASPSGFQLGYTTRTVRGFALLEILLALALFSMVAVGMTKALDQIASTSGQARREAQVLRVLESVLAEVSHQPELKPARLNFPKTADGIDATASIAKVRLQTQDKVELDHVFFITAEAWHADGGKQRLQRRMETYVYSPTSP
jgi:prepilin-type N-terminal cleavage/methylation domain-containing protein